MLYHRATMQGVTLFSICLKPCMFKSSDTTMKKTLIAISFALVSTSFSLAGSISLSIPETTENNSGKDYTSGTAALTAFGNYADGGYLFNGTGLVTPSEATGEGILKTIDGVTSLNLCPRAGAGGSGEAIVLSGSNDIANYMVDAFTLNIAESSSASITGSVTVTLAVIQSGTGTSWPVLQQTSSTLTIGSGISLTLDLDNAIDWSNSYKVVAVIDNSSKTLSGNNANIYTLSGISVTASTIVVPEPSTASLSLLALGALALRRRRA